MRAIDADAFKAYLDYCTKTGMGVTIAFTFKHIIDEQPTIEPERKKGKWIDETFKPWGLVHHPYKCDQCGEHSEADSDFCPNCGADMRTPVETAKDIVHEAINNSVWSDTVDTAKMHKVVDDKYVEIRG